jgi:hypothetical protein
MRRDGDIAMAAQVRPQALQEPLDERLAAAAFFSCSRSMGVTVAGDGCAGDSPVKPRRGDGAGRDRLGEKIRVTPEARSESTWVSSDWRTVEARAYPIRTYPVGTIPAAAGRGSSAQAEPGLRSGGTGTLRAFAR